MLWNQVLSLLAIAEGTDARGEITETETSRQVYADQQSVRQSEFYAAMTAGMKPEIMFVVRACDYQGEQALLHEGQCYKVIRTYSKDGETMELVCSRSVR